MTRALIVDDDPLVRRLLTTVLTAQEIEVVGEGADGCELVGLVNAHRPDVVLLDLHMPRVGGLDALAALRRAGHSTAVVVLTSFGSDDAVLAAIRAGAAGFLGKDDDPERIAAQVRDAAAGRAVAGPRAIDTLVRHAAEASAGREQREAVRALGRLTEREREVASWLPHGWSNPQIARRLYLGESTVKTHLSSAMSKLAVTSREQLAVLVDRAGAAALL
ncbi:response regulator transcription factor [Xylanimonas allomyrinae]|uniref:Response regulator transcription factor n=1 Tax=Xylanimonas allomyrinae TaxID=2509459 RepID=A0A4P6ELF4_9MICO|nr:response regulator transcription factor [Xylanimonas allomyrinae]QAY63452.1 response regulator transcription factor [Xylanimonas allomyrinae]